MKELAAIILAAGKGTRMKSKMPKVLHRVAGFPMLYYPLSVLKGLKAKRVIVVVGHGAEEVRAAFADEKVEFVTQSEQLGTGHAVMTAVKGLAGFRGDILILSGDVPLITKETIKALCAIHRGASLKKRPALSMVTALLEDTKGYGRVVRDEHGAVVRVVEDRDCSPLQREINEVNAGIYLVSSKFLLGNIGRVNNRNAQGEYYLPDLIEIAVKSGEKVSALTHLYPEEVFGINNRVELARADKIMRKRTAEALMLNGVTIIDPDSTYIDAQVKAGMDTVIYPGVHLIGPTVIGEDCVIEENVRIEDSSIGDNSTIKSHSIIEDSEAGKEVSIGPFARLRPGSVIRDRARIGNFVEVKKTVVGKGSKANHLTYLGDSVIGEGVNIGAGTITCNYDGFSKHTTTIEDGAFIGSDTQLVAPVRVGKGAYVGSGTTVTRDVPPDSLVTTRAEERVIEGWAERKRRKGRKKGH
ncbi:MAG: bifunctional UDP-N-acetylglucosamine diphosphorylase/glucosamine-1-phosphate N-acetyltransferase GlmU [Deltaproteobacteria bacterium]|nr:bifunctional UDP-N-acetylglucosamine diphosphorylase/glucosamine-1-phosphate N-acetyltransferase GlmU [Deltaproteobacteria bacterium]